MGENEIIAAGRKLVKREVIVNRAGYNFMQGIAVGYFLVNVLALSGINLKVKKIKDELLGKNKNT